MGHLVQARWTTQGSNSYCSLMNSRPAYVELTTQCQPGRGVSTGWHYKSYRLAREWECSHVTGMTFRPLTAVSVPVQRLCLCRKTHSQYLVPRLRSDGAAQSLMWLSYAKWFWGRRTGPLRRNPLAFAFSFGYKVGVGNGSLPSLPRLWYRKSSFQTHVKTQLEGRKLFSLLKRELTE